MKMIMTTTTIVNAITMMITITIAILMIIITTIVAIMIMITMRIVIMLAIIIFKMLCCIVTHFSRSPRTRIPATNTLLL